MKKNFKTERISLKDFSARKTKIAKAGIFVAMIFCFAPNIFCAPKQFSDIDLVALGPLQPDAEFDTFIIGENAQSYTARRFVAPFYMNAYETTYNLWYVVRVYAEQNGYVFTNPGQEGSRGKRGAPPTSSKSMSAFEPVTMISWYDAVVWCNALSEMRQRTPCYTYEGKVLRDSTDTAALDKCECDWNSDGFRLPTESEWEYGARVLKSMRPPFFQSGALASGQADDETKEGDVAWFDANSSSTKTVGTAGTIWESDAPPAPGSGKANAAGIFDMSGNVMEFCWDWFADYEETEIGSRATGPSLGNARVCRGGSWSPYTGFIYAGDRYSYDPNEAYNFLGFRICSSSGE